MTEHTNRQVFEERIWSRSTRFAGGRVTAQSAGFVGGVRTLQDRTAHCVSETLADTDRQAHLDALGEEANRVSRLLGRLPVEACTHRLSRTMRSINGEPICDSMLHRVRVQTGVGQRGLQLDYVANPAEFDFASVEAALARLARWARALRSAERPAVVSYPSVILDNECSGVLVTMLLGYFLEGDRVAAGTSFMVHHCSGLAFSLPLTATDVLQDSAPVQSLRDEEGTPSARRVVLVDRGRFREHLTDRASARRLGEANNGRCRSAGYQYVPTPRLTNVEVDDGTSTLAELIADTDDGIYLEGMAGAAVDVASGVIHLNGVLGSRIRGGEITGWVAQPGISLEIRRFIAGLAGLGRRSAWSCRAMGKGRPLQNCLIGYRSPQLALDLGVVR